MRIAGGFLALSGLAGVLLSPPSPAAAQFDMAKTIADVIGASRWQFPDTAERRHAGIEIVRACPAEARAYGGDNTEMATSYEGLWSTYDLSGYVRTDPKKYGCFSSALRSQWRRLAANNSPALVDFRQKCAGPRQAWVTHAMRNEGPSAVTEAEVYGITDLYFALLGSDAAAIRQSLDRNSAVRRAQRMPNEISLYDCTGETRIQQLNSGQNAALDNVFN
ncbi:hypothetical protein BH09PSE4_BH09PSE4_10690 [soil metagenome]